MDLPDLDLDLSLLENSTQGSSHCTSIMSANSHQSSRSSDNDGEGSVIGLVIPTSDSGNVGGIEGFELADSGSITVRRNLGTADVLPEEEGFFPDVDFNFDADGNMIELEAPQAMSFVEPPPRIRSDSGTSAKIRQEHEEGFLAGHLGVATPLLTQLDRLNNDFLVWGNDRSRSGCPYDGS